MAIAGRQDDLHKRERRKLRKALVDHGNPYGVSMKRSKCNASPYPPTTAMDPTDIDMWRCIKPHVGDSMTPLDALCLFASQVISNPCTLSQKGVTVECFLKIAQAVLREPELTIDDLVAFLVRPSGKPRSTDSRSSWRLTTSRIQTPRPSALPGCSSTVCRARRLQPSSKRCLPSGMTTCSLYLAWRSCRRCLCPVYNGGPEVLRNERLHHQPPCVVLGSCSCAPLLHIVLDSHYKPPKVLHN